MHRRGLSLLAAATSVVASSPALAWGPQGHMMIAYIAYQQLSADQRHQMVEILKGNPDLYAMIDKGLENRLHPQQVDTPACDTLSS